MGWKKLLQEHKVHHHRTSLQEVNELRKLIAPDLADAAITALSEDRRFATACNAALQAAKMTIACAGVIALRVFPGTIRVRTRQLLRFDVPDIEVRGGPICSDSLTKSNVSFRDVDVIAGGRGRRAMPHQAGQCETVHARLCFALTRCS